MGESLGSHAATAEVEHVNGVAREEGHVGRGLQSVGDVLGSFDLSHRNKTRTVVTDGIGDQLGSFGLTLSSQNGCLGLFLALEDNKFGALSILLCDLLLFNGSGKVARELQVSDRNVVQNNVEFKSAFAEDFTDFLGDLLSLGDELLGVVLGHD